MKQVLNYLIDEVSANEVVRSEPPDKEPRSMKPTAQNYAATRFSAGKVVMRRGSEHATMALTSVLARKASNYRNSVDKILSL